MLTEVEFYVVTIFFSGPTTAATTATSTTFYLKRQLSFFGSEIEQCGRGQKKAVRMRTIKNVAKSKKNH